MDSVFKGGLSYRLRGLTINLVGLHAVWPVGCDLRWGRVLGVYSLGFMAGRRIIVVYGSARVVLVASL